MANTPQAKKRVRQNQKTRIHNASMRSRMRTEVKKFKSTIKSGLITEANSKFPEVASILDSYARKGLIAKNKAARLKSRINAKLKAAAVN